MSDVRDGDIIEPASRPLEVLSLGAGVQSSTMALMAAHGELSPCPDVALFADTGSEPGGVYEHLEWLMRPGVLPFPVEVVSGGDMRADILAAEAGHSEPRHGYADGCIAVPFFVPGSTPGSKSMLRRECTGHYKIRPMRRRIKQILGRDPEIPIRSTTALVRQWVGISADEWQRSRHSDVRWMQNVYPFLSSRLGGMEPGRWMTRGHCLEWLATHGYPTPPKSACTYCPYHDTATWRRMRTHDPEAWRDAVELDEALRRHPDRNRGGAKGAMYVHHTLRPLADVDLDDPTEGQGELFSGGCMGGVCGT